jgi:hypothetical protein
MQPESWEDTARKAKAKARDGAVDLGVNLNPASPPPDPVPPPADHARDERSRAAEAFAAAASAAKARGEKPMPPRKEESPTHERWGRSVGDFILAMVCLISFLAMFAAPGTGAAVCFVVALATGFILTELRRIADRLGDLRTLGLADAARAAAEPTATSRSKAVVNVRDGV